jgi:hypothetical protein
VRNSGSTEVLDGLTGGLLASEEDTILSSGLLNGKLIKGQALASSLRRMRMSDDGAVRWEKSAA